MADPLREPLLRWRRSDPEGFRRFIEAYEGEYYALLNKWVQGRTEDLAKNQGSALTYLSLLLLLKEILQSS